MTSMVLVHGTWLGGWVWQRVIPALEAAGHDVHAPDLPGLATDSAGAREDLGLHAHAAAIVRYLDDNSLTDVVLVGHSYGGIVAQAAASSTDRVSHLVFLDAFLAEEGESAFDLVPWLAGAFQPVSPEVPWLIAPLDPAGLGVTDPDDAAWLAAEMTPMPLATHREALAAPPPVGVPGHYIFCEALPLMEGMLDRAADRDLTVVRLPTAHMPMVTHPELLSSTLIEIIAGPDAITRDHRKGPTA